MYYLRWNTIFTLPDLSADDALRCYMTLSLWHDSFQRGETKLGNSALIHFLVRHSFPCIECRCVFDLLHSNVILSGVVRNPEALRK